eukprot:TRINITY_DN28724_c0_g1_i1.p1 TRINITY_DN28724_c0_g1~~TRINITY_DN28724_c0_g1_i1.p1  ORF type:complete len:206 (+),score=-17.15 TRINITY_DN28724_c0_g1_i1:106-723(+)
MFSWSAQFHCNETLLYIQYSQHLQSVNIISTKILSQNSIDQVDKQILLTLVKIPLSSKQGILNVTFLMKLSSQFLSIHGSKNIPTQRKNCQVCNQNKIKQFKTMNSQCHIFIKIIIVIPFDPRLRNYPIQSKNLSNMQLKQNQTKFDTQLQALFFPQTFVLFQFQLKQYELNRSQKDDRQQYKHQPKYDTNQNTVLQCIRNTKKK